MVLVTIVYLDGDDLWYPNHLTVLCGALQNDGVQAAYLDLCRIGLIKGAAGGERYPFDKRIQVSRPYDRFWR